MMDPQEIARYHTSPAALASELAVRRTMAESGFNDAEIDRMLIVGHVQQTVFRRWTGAAVLLFAPLWLFDVVEINSKTVVVMFVGFVVLFVLARVYAHSVAKRKTWVRVKGGGWTPA